MSAVFERKIETIILDYFNDLNAPVLIIEGARQVGKSFIIRTLGSRHYSHFVEINLVQDKQGQQIFDNIRTTKDFYYAVQSSASEPLGDSSDTLVFIDEIQEQENLITMLKFLRDENRYRYIVSGSLLGLEFKKTASVPVGSVSTVRMYPMDIEEFLWANGIQKELLADLRSMIGKRESVPDGLHKRIMDLFRDYLISGGLPYCVDVFLKTQDIVSVRNAQKDILEMYGNDAARYDIRNKMHTKIILDMIPSNIENKRKRIFAKDIEGKANARFDKFSDDFDSLVDSGVVLKVDCCSNPVFPLIESMKRNLLKLYYADVGLLTYVLYRNNFRPLREDLPQINLGNVYECVAAMQLSANGHRLFYMDSKPLGEVDYLIDDCDSLSVTALEIKSGKDHHRHNALDKLMKSENWGGRGIVLSNTGTVETDGKLTYLPIYALMFI